MNARILALCAACICPTADALARAMTAECPPGLPPSSVRPGEPVSGWVMTPKQMHLHAAGMMMGGPATSMYITPVVNTNAKQVFVFEPGEGERWLWCGYGGVQLARRLDDRATRCTLVSRTQRRDGAPTLTAIVTCR